MIRGTSLVHRSVAAVFRREGFGLRIEVAEHGLLIGEHHEVADTRRQQMKSARGFATREDGFDARHLW